MYMPVAPAYGYGNNGGGFGFGGADGWWVILLLLIFGNGMFGGYGGGMWPMMMGGMGGGFELYPWLNNSQHLSDGFRDQQIQSTLAGIQSGITSGFGDVQNALCAGFAGVNANVANGFAQAEIGANARQIANMQQAFAAQTATQQGFNGVGTGIADLKYTVAAEECATRTNSTQNTQGILNAINGGIQSIKDQLCQDKIDAKNDEIATLRQQIAMKDLAASQTAQNAFIQRGFSDEVDALYNRLSNCPVPSTPVYGRTPIFTCNNSGCGCGCGCGNGF
jgi:hypothetical protein